MERMITMISIEIDGVKYELEAKPWVIKFNDFIEREFLIHTEKVRGKLSYIDNDYNEDETLVVNVDNGISEFKGSLFLLGGIYDEGKRPYIYAWAFRPHDKLKTLRKLIYNVSINRNIERFFGQRNG